MNIALIGYGKMGKAVEEALLQRGHHVSLGISLENKADLTKKNLKKADVAIEFTRPDDAIGNLYECFYAGIPVVCGTTGWHKEISAVKKVCKQQKGALLYSSNFSVGVNIFFEINKYVAKLIKYKRSYDVSIDETHHTQKKDSPSGTAIALAETILKHSTQKKSWINESSSNPAELSIVSHRIDPVAGTHKIKYSSEIDDIELIHTAHNRKGFATGAVLAAEFLKNKKGIFTMKDVLGF